MGWRRNKAKWSTQEGSVEWFRVRDSKVISELPFCQAVACICCVAAFCCAVDQVVLIFTL